MTNNTFDVILLIGRPASGKSEIIYFLTHLPAHIRGERFHIAQLEVHDDFPMLWAWFEEDDLLNKKFGLPRLHSDVKSSPETPVPEVLEIGIHIILVSPSCDLSPKIG